MNHALRLALVRINKWKSYHILRNGGWRQGVCVLDWAAHGLRLQIEESVLLLLCESGARIMQHGLTLCKRWQQTTVATTRRSARTHPSPFDSSDCSDVHCRQRKRSGGTSSADSADSAADAAAGATTSAGARHLRETRRTRPTVAWLEHVIITIRQTRVQSQRRTWQFTPLITDAAINNTGHPTGGRFVIGHFA